MIHMAYDPPKIAQITGEIRYPYERGKQQGRYPMVINWLPDCRFIFYAFYRVYSQQSHA